MAAGPGALRLHRAKAVRPDGAVFYFGCFSVGEVRGEDLGLEMLVLI